MVPVFQVVHMWEDDRWLDEPLSAQANFTSPDDYGHYDHIYTANLPETRDLLKQMYDVVKSYGDDKSVLNTLFFLIGGFGFLSSQAISCSC